MFYLTYLRQELRRRAGRTVLTVCGLAVGVALVVSVTALSAGVRRAQAQVLGPLAGVGTDMTVTKQGSFAGGSFGATVPGGTLQTDLSKLGKPGERFSTDAFFSAQPSFDTKEFKKISGIDGVRATSGALLLRGIHQEGTIPKAGGSAAAPGAKKPAPKPLTDAQRKEMTACLSENRPAPSIGPGADPFDSAFQGLARCMPQSVLDLRTNINSGQFTVTGVEPDAGIGLVSPDQVIAGRFLEKNGEAILSESYATGRKLTVGSTLKLKDRSYEVVGLIKPPLSGDTSDVYLTLADLRKVSGHEGETNLVLVRASDASQVKDVSSSIQRAVPGAAVSDASALAGRVAGSLVDSASLIKGLGLALAVVGIIASVLIAVLLTLSSVAKRTRELGTLKAIGWGPKLVVRQIVLETAAQGVLGAVLGIVLGIAAAALLGMIGPSLSARTVGADGPANWFGLGSLGEQASEVVRLTAPVRPSMVLLAAVLAVAGGLVAGAAGAMRVARLRPADAMREVS